MNRLKSFFFSSLVCLAATAGAQDQDIQQTARAFMRTGDFDNAILVLNRALASDKQNLELQKDLVLAQYYKRDYTRALEGAKVLIDRSDADVVSFQIAGNVYKALEDVKEAGKMYRKALKKFPNSGPLLSEYGELLWAAKDNEAITHWEKGIQVDPSYAGNYYNAALYYSYTKDKVWTLVYGEIFVNMESLTERATAMKKLLLDMYKEKLFNDQITVDAKNQSEFEKAFIATMKKQEGLTSRGLTTESLTAIRSRFILDWFATYAAKFPFKLFDYQQQLLREGMFEAYNQWLFGTVENLPAYETWISTNKEAYNTFTTFQRGRVFRMPAGQYYKKS